MLRALVLVLVMANLLYLVWVKNLLGPYGFGPANQAEPERLQQQIRPEAIQLLEPNPAPNPTPNLAKVNPLPKSTASAPTPTPTPVSTPTSAPVAIPAIAPVAARIAAPAPIIAPIAASVEPAPTPAPTPAPAPVPRQCLQAGLFTERQANAMRGRLQANLPPGSWSFVAVKEPTRWIVYLGSYTSKEALKKKRAQLERAGISVESPASPELNPGLSLGSYHSQAQAKAALAKFAKRGITAEVVQDKPELPNRLIRLPAADKALQAKAKTLILRLSGQPLKFCS